RDLTRTRKQLVREITQHTLRIQKTLETANLKLTGLLSNILGMSGRAILQALVAGETDPQRLAHLVHGRLKASRAHLVAAPPRPPSRSPPLPAPPPSHPGGRPGAGRARRGGAARPRPRPVSHRPRPTDHDAGRE